MLPNHSHSLRSSQCCVCVKLVKLWLLVKKIEYRQALFAESYVTWVTLKIRSMSPKSNKLFLLSQISICASLETIQLTVNTLEHTRVVPESRRLFI